MMSEDGAKTLTNLGYNELGDLVRKIDRLPQNENIESAGRAFEAQAKSNIFSIGKVNDQLKNNPQLSENITKLMKLDPPSFEKALPGIFKNPDSTVDLINNALKTAQKNAPAAPAPLTVAAAAAAATSLPKPNLQTPSKPAVAAAAPPAARTPSPEPVAGTSGATPKPASGQTFADKMAALSGVEGFSDLKQRIDTNPHLQNMFKGLMSGSSSDAERDAAIDGVLEQTKKDPKLLSNLVKTIDKKPGIVSSIASSFSGSPSAAMTTMGIYSSLSEGFLGPMIDKFFGPGAFDKLFSTMMNFAGGNFSTSKNFLVGATNSGMATLDKAVKATGANPETIARVEDGQVVRGTGAQAENADQNKPNPAAQQQNRLS